jgi:hypothetical protein
MKFRANPAKKINTAEVGTEPTSPTWGRLAGRFQGAPRASLAHARWLQPRRFDNRAPHYDLMQFFARPSILHASKFLTVAFTRSGCSNRHRGGICPGSPGRHPAHEREPGDAIGVPAVGFERDLRAHRMADQHGAVHARDAEHACDILCEVFAARVTIGGRGGAVRPCLAGNQPIPSHRSTGVVSPRSPHDS